MAVPTPAIPPSPAEIGIAIAKAVITIRPVSIADAIVRAVSDIG